MIDGLATLGLRFEERPFTIAEAQSAAEAFLTGATTLVMPVVEIDGVTVGNGSPGPVSLKLRSGFHHFAVIGT